MKPARGSGRVETIIDTDAVSLWYYPETRIVHHEIPRFVHGVEFRNLLEKGLQVLRSHRASKWGSGAGASRPLPERGQQSIQAIDRA